MDLALEQLGVGHDQLLAGQRAQPRRLEADPLDRAGAVVVADRVALLERLVEQDGESGEQIREDALSGEADGNSADPQAGNQRRDVHAEIVEDQDAGDREQCDADQHPNDRHRIAERARAILIGDAAADQAQDQLAAPDRALECEGDGEGDVDQMRRPVRQLGVIGDDVGGRENHERDVGLGEDAADHCPPAQAFRIAGDYASTETAQDHHQSDDRDADNESDQQAVAVGFEPGGETIHVHRRCLGGEDGRDQAAAGLGCFFRNGINATSHDDSHLRARGRSIPPSGSRGRSLTAAIRAGWT